jgi:hypothetical protein
MNDRVGDFIAGAMMGLTIGILGLMIIDSCVGVRPVDIENPAKAWSLYREVVDNELQRHNEAMGGKK